MRYCVTTYQGSKATCIDFDSADDAYESAKGSPHTCVSVYDDDGWLLKDYHFSPKHPIIGVDDLLEWQS